MFTDAPKNIVGLEEDGFHQACSIFEDKSIKEVFKYKHASNFSFF